MSAETIQFSCSACGTSLTVPVQLAGVKGPCPQCGAEIQAPTAVVPEAPPVANVFTGNEPAVPPSAVMPPPAVPSNPEVTAPTVATSPVSAPHHTQAPPTAEMAPAAASANMLGLQAAGGAAVAEFPELPPVHAADPVAVAPQPREVPAHSHPGTSSPSALASPPAAAGQPSPHPGATHSVVVPSAPGSGAPVAAAEVAAPSVTAPPAAQTSSAGSGLASLLNNAQQQNEVAKEPEPKRRRKGRRRVKAEPEKPGRLKDQPRRGPDRPYKSMDTTQYVSEKGQPSGNESGDAGGGLVAGLGGRSISPPAEPAKKGNKGILALAALLVIGGFAAAGYFLWPKYMVPDGLFASGSESGSTVKPFIIAKNPDGSAADGSAPQAKMVGETSEPVVDPVIAKIDPAPPEAAKNSEAGPEAKGAESPTTTVVAQSSPGPGEVVPRPANPVSSNNPVPPPVPANADHAAAQRALEKFLNAKTMDERFQFVHSPEKIEKEMESYYGRHPQGIEPTRVDFQLSNKLRDSNYNFHVFEVTTRQQPDPFPVSVEETSEGHKIDWRLFIEFHDNLLGRFTKIYQERPEQFRVMLERAHYFRSDIPEVGNKLCFRIRPPMLGYEGYCFVTADTSFGKELEAKFDWDVLYMPIVELQWFEVDGWKFIKLTKVIQDNWRTSF
ncbi:MAG: hypothetical protein AAGJ79_04215 [Verrucomicrobiota bacterium]